MRNEKKKLVLQFFDFNMKALCIYLMGTYLREEGLLKKRAVI